MKGNADIWQIKWKGDSLEFELNVSVWTKEADILTHSQTHTHTF